MAEPSARARYLAQNQTLDQADKDQGQAKERQEQAKAEQQKAEAQHQPIRSILLFWNGFRGLSRAFVSQFGGARSIFSALPLGQETNC